MDIRRFFSQHSDPSTTSLTPDGNAGKRREGLSSTMSISKKPRLKEDESSSALLQPNSSTVFDSDIGLYIGKQIDDNIRKKLLLSPWKPDFSFIFPSSGPRNLKFVLRWLAEWDWLVYSPSQDGAFCKFCFLFCTTVGKQSSCPGKLVKYPFKKWKDAREVFREHEEEKYHADSLQKAGMFISTHSEGVPSIDKALERGHVVQVKKNRELLKPIISIAIFLARRGLAFRGHRDSGTLSMNEHTQKAEGNFRSLLSFRIESGDTVLKEHLKKAGANATYISWQIQNEIISSLNNIILKNLVEKVKDSQWFSVLVDETTDVGTVAQMTFCVRFVKNGKVHEEFLQFIPITDMTGKGLADVICKTINDLNLQPEFMVGQGYDAAGAMSGHMKGVQALIQEKYPKATYVQCSSHCLNLCISEGCSVQVVRNCMGTTESAYNFFNTPKRQAVLTTQIEMIENEFVSVFMLC